MVEYELIYEWSGLETVTTPPGTKVIKTAWLPTDKQTGDYRVLMTFDTPYPYSMWGDLIDRDGKELWRGLIEESHSFNVITEFHAENQAGFSVRRWESGNLPLTLTRLNVYWKPTIIEEAKGEITLCNINGSSCPNCGQANSGDEISVIAEMKNVGAVKGKFMFYVLDQHGNELSKAGGIGYKDVDAGETWKVTPASWDDLDFDMPASAIIEGHLKLARLE